MTKVCSKCRKRKKVSSFFKRKADPDGYAIWCKQCAYAYGTQWRKANPNRLRNYALKRFYGCTWKQREKMAIKQNYKCLICEKSEEALTKILVVDHCHKTGKIRGLLCNNCNNGIGYLKENMKSLKNATKYLKRFLNE